jgi:hypothetical protein
VSWVCNANSRVGATTRTLTVDFEFLDGPDVMRRERAGMPNASVLPLNKICMMYA